MFSICENIGKEWRLDIAVIPIGTINFSRMKLEKFKVQVQTWKFYIYKCSSVHSNIAWSSMCHECVVMRCMELFASRSSL